LTVLKEYTSIIVHNYFGIKLEGNYFNVEFDSPSFKVSEMLSLLSKAIALYIQIVGLLGHHCLITIFFLSMRSGSSRFPH
jgi:hypothetical protein